MRSHRANQRPSHPTKAAHHNLSPEPRPHKTANAIFAGSLASAAAVAGSLATEPDGEWYRTLRKPTWR